MILVINEWIFHDLLGENGEEKFRETARFVIRLHDSDDKIVEPNEERWRMKALQLETVSDLGQRDVCQIFLRLFYDSDRTIRLHTGDDPAPSDGSYDWAPHKDIYLVEACDTTNADLLITTNETLFDKVSEHGQFNCQMREDFLTGYTLSR